MAVRTCVILLALVVVIVPLIGPGVAYERPPARKMYVVPADDNKDPNHPEQVPIFFSLPEFSGEGVWWYGK